MSNGYIFSPNSLTVTYDGTIFTINKDTSEYSEAIDAINEDRWEDIPDIVDRGKRINDHFAGTGVVVRDGVVYVDGEEVPGILNRRIVQFMEEKAPYQPLVNFWNKLKSVHSNRVLTELYGFLEASSIPIMPDGRILCYKVVTRHNENVSGLTQSYNKVTVKGKNPVKSYVDIYTSTVHQTIGDVVSMTRNAVDDNSGRTCSHGLECVASY